jgi:hypothetical protein
MSKSIARPKSISGFRNETYGLFIDLAGDEGTIGVDPATGAIFLDEGHGSDRFNGAVIQAADFRGMYLALAEDRRSGTLVLTFGNNRSHALGTTFELDTANHWIEAVAKAISAHVKTSNNGRGAPPVGPPSSVSTAVQTTVAETPPQNGFPE